MQKNAHTKRIWELLSQNRALNKDNTKLTWQNISRRCHKNPRVWHWQHELQGRRRRKDGSKYIAVGAVQWCSGTAQNESEAYNLGRRRQTYDCLQAFNWKRLTLILRFFCGFLLTSGELLDVVQFLSEWRLTPPHSSSLPLGSRECAPSVSGTVSDGASSPLSSS